MKLERKHRDGFLFRLSAREKDLLFETIKLYPLVPAQHHRLTKTAAHQSDENQRLLEEALAEQRAENRRQIEAMLQTPERLKQSGKSFLLQLPMAEVNGLLQILNDVRVGSWLELGEPDEDKPPQITADNFRYALALEVCGVFQSFLLAALGETESPDWLAES